MNIIIVEDNLIQRELLELYILKLGYQVIGTFDAGETLIENIENLKADVILMDINLSGFKTGIETSVAALRMGNPKIIYTTAQTQSSILEKAADTSPLDILIKPFRIEQLQASLLLAKNKTNAKDIKETSKYLIKNGFLVFKDGHMFERMHLNELLYIEGDGNYFHLNFKRKKSTLKGSLSNIEASLPNSDFIRVNRSYIISVKEVTSFNNRRIVISTGEEFTLSRAHAENAMHKLIGK